jgi:hypothetical protein
MSNPWLEIPLANYEAHMALPTIGQMRLIAECSRVITSVGGKHFSADEFRLCRV